MTTTIENASIPEEGNYYQILAIPSTASLVEIRKAYEEQLEAAHLEAISAYSLFPEEQTEQKLLQIGQAFVTLANPIARAKYDDEIQLTIDSEQQTDSQQESAPISEAPLTEKPAQKKTETAALLIKMKTSNLKKKRYRKAYLQKLLDKHRSRDRIFTLTLLLKMNRLKKVSKNITQG